MNSFEIIKKKIENYRIQNPNTSRWNFLIHLLKGSWRVIVAKFYLKGCTKAGKMVSVNGKPTIDNKGIMIIGDEVRIWSSIVKVQLYTGINGQLIVGKNSRLNGVHIDAREMVRIGDNVRIAPYSIILDSDFHDIKDHFSEGSTKAIIIEDNVWIATRVMILKGVRIGRNSVIAAGAVVTKDIPPNCIAGGIPAKIIKRIDN